MPASAIRQRLTDNLLREFKEERFPNVTMMDRIEASLGTREELEEYVEALVERAEASPYPNLPLLRRIDALLERLEELERRDGE
jgi:hypothetical protein